MMLHLIGHYVEYIKVCPVRPVYLDAMEHKPLFFTDATVFLVQSIVRLHFFIANQPAL